MYLGLQFPLFIKRLLLMLIFFLPLLSCTTGTVKEAKGPTVTEAQAESAVGPKARIAVAQFVNNTGGLESQLQRMALQMQSQMSNFVTQDMTEYQNKMMAYQHDMTVWQMKAQEAGTDKAGPPPEPPKLKKTSSPYMTTVSDPVAGGIRDMMINALFSSGNYIVLERQSIDKINWEQEFSRSSRAGSKTKIDTGQIEGAELILIGSLNTLDAQESGGEIGGVVDSVTSYFFGHQRAEETTEASISWENAKAAMEIRLVDTRTSRVVAATTVEGKARSMGFGASKTKYTYNAGDLPQGFSAYQNTPVEDAFRKMVDAAVQFLITRTPDKYYHYQE